MLNNNWIALLVTFLVALAFLRLMDFIAHRGWISSHLSRKLIHIGTGPLFVLCWPLFDQSISSRFLAALVPLSFTIQFALIGLGVIRDEASVQAMSRSGDRREILRGPLFYGIVFVLLTILFWTDSPTGIVALMMVCGGDGLAEILGTRYGKVKLPWSHQKSWIGSTGFFLGSWILSVLVLWYFVSVGQFPEPLALYLFPITLIGLASTLVESITPRDLDNITVPAVSVILGLLLF